MLRSPSSERATDGCPSREPAMPSPTPSGSGRFASSSSSRALSPTRSCGCPVHLRPRSRPRPRSPSGPLAGLRQRPADRSVAVQNAGGSSDRGSIATWTSVSACVLYALRRSHVRWRRQAASAAAAIRVRYRTTRDRTTVDSGRIVWRELQGRVTVRCPAVASRRPRSRRAGGARCLSIECRHGASGHGDHAGRRP